VRKKKLTQSREGSKEKLRDCGIGEASAKVFMVVVKRRLRPRPRHWLRNVLLPKADVPPRRPDARAAAPPAMKTSAAQMAPRAGSPR
jgi:hypothetical protein